MRKMSTGRFQSFRSLGGRRGPVAILSGLALLAAAQFAAPGYARAQESSPPQESSFTLEGKISDVAPGKLTINTEDNIIFHVRYNDQTRITRADGTPGSSKDLKVGVRVYVAGDLEESGEIKAAEIRIQKTSGSKHP